MRIAMIAAVVALSLMGISIELCDSFWGGVSVTRGNETINIEKFEQHLSKDNTMKVIQAKDNISDKTLLVFVCMNIFIFIGGMLAETKRIREVFFLQIGALVILTVFTINLQMGVNTEYMIKTQDNISIMVQNEKITIEEPNIKPIVAEKHMNYKDLKVEARRYYASPFLLLLLLVYFILVMSLIIYTGSVKLRRKVGFY